MCVKERQKNLLFLIFKHMSHIMKNQFLALALFFSFLSYSQSLDYNNSYESINICTAIQGNNFASEKAADSALDDILNVIGASKRFVLQECSNINNAVALTMNGVRYIMYDPEFMTSLAYGDQWSNKFILAHEVGHHINGHTVDVLAANSSNKVSLSTSRIQELEADEFAGFVLGRLGASLSNALSGVQSLSDKDDSYSTHPRRSRRIAAIKKGFKESGGYVNPSTVSVKKGKTVDSPYSNSRFSGVEYVTKDIYSGVYTGYVGMESREPFGYGEYRTPDGYIYEGEWSDGDYNGYGKQIWPAGGSYEGYFVSDTRSGKGVYSNEDGRKFNGTWANGTLVKGIKIFSDKTKQEGSWSTNGNQILVDYTDENGVTKKIGFLDGSNGEGFGIFTYWDGSTLKGVFSKGGISKQKGLLAGEFGTINRRNSNGKRRKRKEYKTFVTDFIPKQLHSQLEITIPETHSFTGYGGSISPYDVGRALTFLDRHKNENIYNNDLTGSVKIYSGRGTLEDGNYSSAEWLTKNYGGYSYVGELLLGFAEFKWVEGHFYEGFFLSGSRSKAGYGEIIYSSNDERESYKGMWWDDKKNGYGIMKYKDGRIEKGVFKNNVFVKTEGFDFDLMQKTFKNWY
tara:strand:- start:324 stop:2201 length:1878 start_codon:yes stop_codon:yes gene_type:complete